MRRLIVLMGLVGCSADGGGDDDKPPLRPPDDDDAAADREECEAATTARCPPGWASTYYSGASPPPILGIADIGEPICNDKGIYVEPAFFEVVARDTIVGVPLVRNSQCSIVCYPQCRFGSVCWAERSDGQQCGTGCMGHGLTEDECAAFVAECLGDDASACEEPPR